MTRIVPQEDLLTLEIQMVENTIIESIFARKYDSIFAQSGVANNGSQMHNEYVVFNRDQVYPEYLVTFTVS